MNAKQALRAASKRIEELEYYNARASADIRDYNRCIDSMIAGGSPCDWCEDLNECQLEAKGKGCPEWMLRNPPKEENHETVPVSDETEKGEDQQVST